jgi:hypothetical protein
MTAVLVVTVHGKVGAKNTGPIKVILWWLASRMVMFRARKCDCDGASEVVSDNLRICLAEEDPITNEAPFFVSSSQQEDDDESPIGIVLVR